MTKKGRKHRKQNRTEISCQQPDRQETNLNNVLYLSSIALTEEQSLPTAYFNLFNTLLDIKKFVRNITLSKHFLTDTVTTTENLTHQLDDVYINEYKDLCFLEQCTLQDRSELSSTSKNGCHVSSKDIQYRNLCFYPVKSRVLSLEQFQNTVERDLKKL